MQPRVDPERTGRLDVDGCPIAWAAWDGDRPTAPPIVLVHGASAHRGWWDPVIAALDAREGPTGEGRPPVVALELSGHGDSGHRESYGAGQWAREVAAVITEVAGGPVLLVGHSLGGRVAVCAAAREPLLTPAVVLVDSPLRPPAAEPEGRRRRRVIPARLGPRTVHPTLDAAVGAFRLRPREPVRDTELLHRIAADAHRRCEGGWTLRADLTVFNRTTDEELDDALRRVEQPITFVYGTHSAVVDDAVRRYLTDTHPGDTELVAIEGHHHLTLDQGTEVAGVIARRWAALAAASARQAL